MGRKGVNLLEGDDEEREGDSQEDSGDDGGSYERRRGGFVDVLMVILFVCVMLGGVAWAGYQFWWLPKVKKEAQLERARKKQEQQRKMPVANRQGATERAQRAPGGFSQTASAQAQQRAMSATARNTLPERPALSRPTETPAPPAAPMAKRMPATPGPAGSAPSAAVARMEKPARPPTPSRKEAAGRFRSDAKTRLSTECGGEAKAWCGAGGAAAQEGGAPKAACREKTEKAGAESPKRCSGPQAASGFLL